MLGPQVVPPPALRGRKAVRLDGAAVYVMWPGAATVAAAGPRLGAESEPRARARSPSARPLPERPCPGSPGAEASRGRACGAATGSRGAAAAGAGSLPWSWSWGGRPRAGNDPRSGTRAGGRAGLPRAPTRLGGRGTRALLTGRAGRPGGRPPGLGGRLAGAFRAFGAAAVWTRARQRSQDLIFRSVRHGGRPGARSRRPWERLRSLRIHGLRIFGQF